MRAIITISLEKERGSFLVIRRAMSNSYRIQATTSIFTPLKQDMIQLLIFFFAITCIQCKNSDSTFEEVSLNSAGNSTDFYDTTIVTGDEQLDLYLPLIKNKTVSLLVNQSYIGNKTHLVDTLISVGVRIKTIFAPEHGFRGDADDGATIKDSKDVKTGIAIISLYGSKKKPTAEDLKETEVLIFDIQDVGARFYTFLSSLHYIMEACAENNIELIVLDRPNPNGHYVDGPVLKKEFSSFVGMHPIPIVHGMTFGELAQMINNEGWLQNGEKCKLTVIPCKNYTHKSFYKIDTPPSPNLRNMESIYLYPSLCLFEGTNVSVGRGTDHPFQMIGSPYTPLFSFAFTPKSTFGSSSPPFKDQVCLGYNLTTLTAEELISQKFTLQYLLNMYNAFTDKSKFFLSSNYFNKLAGTDELRKQMEAGLTEEEIRLSWQDDLASFKKMRKKYLLYPDFE